MEDYGYNRECPLRCFFAFEGYNSQGLALNRLKQHYPDFDWVCVGRSEIDKYAIQAADALFPEAKDKNFGDISTIDWDDVPDFDLFTMSSPCQDFSQSGLQKGGAEGSGTRSSLLWECRRAILAKKPKYIVFENVKALVSQKFLPYFLKWQNELASYGYSNFAKVLNARDFGIPQNRERIFMVSILDENANYHFPEPFPLDKRLKDVLEEDVDEKYYLSKKIIDTFIERNKINEDKGNGFKFEPTDGDCVASSVLTMPGSRPCDNYIKEPIACAMRGRNPDNPSDRTAGIPTEQRVEVGGDVANCITTVQKDSFVVVPKIIQVANISEEKSFSNPQTGRIYSSEGLCPTLDTMHGGGRQPKIVERYRIRKLTPRECFRLMDVKDIDTDKIQAAGISKTRLYCMAGNSICVGVLFHIFRKLFIETENENQQLTLF